MKKTDHALKKNIFASCLSPASRTGFAAIVLLASISIVIAQTGTSKPPAKDFETLDGVSFGVETVVFKLSGKARYNVFKISNPERIVVDFTGVEHNLKSKETFVPADVKNDIVAKVRTGQFQNAPIKIARAVVELKKDVNYEVKTLSNGKEVVVSFINDKKETSAKNTATAPVVTSTSSVGVATATVTSSSPAAVSSGVAVSTTSSTSPGRLKPVEVVAVPIEEEKSVATTTAAPAAVTKDQTPPVTPPATSIIASSPQKQKDVKQPEPVKPAASPASAKKDEKPAAVKSPQPAVKKEEPRVLKTTLPKTLVSFDFQDADIRDVLRVLSSQSGINIIYGSDVSGLVTITLKNVPFDQAFSTILTLNNLVSQDLGSNIIRVMTPQTLAQERTQAVTFTKIFPLNYAKAEDVKTQLDAIRAAEGRRGIISVDSRTNTLIITDTQEGLDSAARIIQEVDKKPYQVLIEAKIVEVNLDKKLDLGINWSYARAIVSGSETQYVGKTQATVGGTSGLYYGMPSGASSVEETGPTGGGAGVNFPASPVSGQLSGISFGLISDNVRLNAMLSMLASKGLTKLLSNPKVTTLNNQEARILVGERVPYVQQTTQLGTASGGVSSEVQWLEVGIKLTVTPTINADRQITLKVFPQVSLLSRVTAAGPVVGTREAQTTVMIKDNETVVIGGLIREEDIKSAAQVPLLGDIPVLGQLFKRKYDSKERSELLVFITPHIVDASE